MRKPVGWQNESYRHALASRGIPTTMRSRGMTESVSITKISTELDTLHRELEYFELETGVERGNIESMERFVVVADEIIAISESVGLDREKYIKHLKKARSNIKRALIDQKFMYKYLKQTHRPFQISPVLGKKVYRSKVEDDLFPILYTETYPDLKVKLKNIELRRKLL